MCRRLLPHLLKTIIRGLHLVGEGEIGAADVQRVECEPKASMRADQCLLHVIQRRRRIKYDLVVSQMNMRQEGLGVSVTDRCSQRVDKVVLNLPTTELPRH